MTIQQMIDSQDGDMLDIIERLEAGGDGAIETLVSGLRHKRPDVLCCCRATLVKFGARAWPTLVRLLAGESAGVRSHAAFALALQASNLPEDLRARVRAVLTELRGDVAARIGHWHQLIADAGLEAMGRELLHSA